MMYGYAQTNSQLFKQARDAGCEILALSTLRAGNDLALGRFAGDFRRSFSIGSDD